jgi:hypothetical protein
MPVIDRPATERQLAFLNALRVERGFAAIDRDDWVGVTTRDASRHIDQMKAKPRPPRAAGAALRQPAGAGMLEGLPLSKYALREDGHLTFWVVAEFRGTRYLRLLVGAPGEFRRVRVEYARARRVAEAIRENSLAAAQAFARHYTCCAVCGADLSDTRSVELGLGPICRQRFGL